LEELLQLATHLGLFSYLCLGQPKLGRQFRSVWQPEVLGSLESSLQVLDLQ
jgi:hypothetical protein